MADGKKILGDYPASGFEVKPAAEDVSGNVARPGRLPTLVSPVAPTVTSPVSRQGGGNIKPFKPFPFALKKEDGGGFRIFDGKLVSWINRLVFDAAGAYVSQLGIGLPIVTDVSNILVTTAFESQTFAWNGDVYLYWETGATGIPTLCEIRDAAGIDSVNLPLATEPAGKFYVKIGSVPAGAGEIVQDIGSDVYWYGAFAEEDTGSSPSGGGSSPSGGSGGGGTSFGSSKDTAIVPAGFARSGFTALAAMESPDVRFEDVLADLKIRGERTRYRIDPRFMEVIEPGTLRVVGWSSDSVHGLGFHVAGDTMTITAARDKRRRPKLAQVKVSAIRKGFLTWKFPDKTLAQFEANERRLNGT